MAQKIGDGYLEIEGRPDKSQIRKAAEESGKIGGGAFSGAFGKVTSVALKSAMGVVFTALIAQAGALGIQLLALVPTLATLGSLTAALPAGIIAMITASAVLKASLAGVGEAAKAAFAEDPAKFNEALKELSPSARKFAMELRETVKPLKAVQQAMQEAFFSTGLPEQIGKIDNIIQQLSPNLRAVAGLFGNIGAEFIAFNAQAQSLQVLNGIIGALADGVGIFAGNFTTLLTGFRDVTAVALPLFEAMARGIGEAAGTFGAWMSSIAASGQLQSWINTALSTLATLGQILSNLGSIFMSVMQAAQTAGGGALQVFAQLTGTFAAFLSSAEGMAALTSLFSGIMAVAQALMPVLTTLVGVLATALGPAIQEIALVLGPVLLQAVQAVAPAIGPLVTALVAVITAIAPVIPVIGQLANLLGGILAQALTALAPMLGLILGYFAQLAGPVLGALGTVLMTLLTALQPVINALVGALAPIMPVIVNMFTMLITAAAPLVTLIGQFLAGAIQQLLPPLYQLIPIIITALLPAFHAMMPAIMSIVQALFPLIPLLAQLIVALMPVIVMLAELQATIMSQLIPAIAPLIVIIIELVTTIVGALIPVLIPVIKYLVEVATTITGLLIGALASAANAIRPVISAIASFIGKLVESAASIVKFGQQVIKAVNDIRQKILDFYKGAVSWLVDAGKDIIKGLINGIKSMASAAVNAAKGVVQDALSAAKNLLGISSPSKVFMQIGRDTVAGLAKGLMQSGPVDDAMRSLIDSTTAPTVGISRYARGSSSVSPFGGGGSGGSGGRQASLSIGSVNINVSGVAAGDARGIGESIADGLLQRLAEAALVR